MKFALKTIPLWLLLAVTSAMAAQSNRISAAIDGNRTVVLKGSVRAQTRAGSDQGPVDPALPLPYVVMVMKPSPAQQADLNQLLAQQQDPDSPNYHKWLTPERFAERFGLSASDVEKINTWLRSQGFSVVQNARGRDWIAFSATAGLVENAFHTQIHRYQVDGESHFANAAEVAVPSALVGAVGGFLGLDDFRWKPMGVGLTPRQILPALVHPFFTFGGNNFLAPDDFATIYDLTSLYTSGIDGTGMKMVVVGQVDIAMSDIENFRSNFNLPANDPTVLTVPGSPDPGNNSGDLLESDLDLEWAGAIARNAKIIFVTSNASVGGVFNSAIYAIDNDLAPVISMSYGGCEELNDDFIAANEPTMQKANAEGITFVASSGDAGPAGCDAPGAPNAARGLGVSYPASSPEVTAIGGTEFSGDVNNIPQYWNNTNGPNGGSAISYIPEIGWNDTVERGSLAASGGGRSTCHSPGCGSGFPKPSWQAGVGVPADGVRDVPDVSFNASPDHDGYIVCSQDICSSGVVNGNFDVVGGTSASAPAFAGLLTLLNQQLGNLPPAGLGNANPSLYRLAKTPANNVFHDITTGDNIVPCLQNSPNCPKTAPFQYGFHATTGYDLVTGLGSIDVGNLLTHWNDAKAATTSTLSVSPTTFGVGSQVTLTATVSPNVGNGMPSGAVAFLINGTTPAGTAQLSNRTATLKFTAKSLKAGMNTFTAVYGGDVLFVNSQSASMPVTVQDFTVTLPSNPTIVTVNSPGGSGTASLTVTPEFGFDQAVDFSCTSLPREATCSANSVSPNGGPVMTTLTVSTAAPSAQLHSKAGAWFYAVLIPSLLGLVWLPVMPRRFRRTRSQGLMTGLLCLLLGLFGCGGGGGSSTPAAPPDPGTPAGTTTIKVVAVGPGGAPSHTAEILLTVK